MTLGALELGSQSFNIDVWNQAVVFLWGIRPLLLSLLA